VKKLRELPVVGPLLDVLDNASTIGAVLFVIVAAFLSYSDWVAPDYRDEAVLLSLVLAVCSFVGFTLLDIAFYITNRYRKEIYERVGDAVDKGEDLLESALGDKDVIPAWLEQYVQHEAQKLFDDFVATHPPSARLEAKVAELEAKLGEFLKS